ncbi:MAG: IS3 family transposase [Acidibacillus sp.]|nr:IS3 family transposase [Sulfoacidibacillus ferrooxidans]MCY0892571.1 IS3 family transposase [Acidibacillus sp.]
MTKRIHQIFLSSRCLYGSPMNAQVLREEGERILQKTVAHIMRENGLKCRTICKNKATTNSKHNYPVHDYVLNQTFTAERPNESGLDVEHHVCVDHRRMAVCCQCRGLDLYTSNIVGWEADSRMTKELTIEALEEAYQREKGKREIWESIELWYNRLRFHLSIGYITPVQFRAAYAQLLLTIIA